MSSRRAATGPNTRIDGGRRPWRSTSAASVSSVATAAFWPGSVPRSIAAAGSAGIAPRLDQAPGDVGQVLDAHVEDERSREVGERLPVERRLGLIWVLVAGDERDRRGVVAVCDGNARVRGSGDTRGDTGHDLEVHAGRSASFGLLAAAAEHERVAALEPHHAEPPLRPLDKRLR